MIPWPSFFPDKVTTGVAVLSAVTLYFAHDFAHQFYGANAQVIGDVGLFIAAFTLTGIFLNAMIYEDVMGVGE